jgi:ectoine hydroxylase-related dioxygenase (phytanoyl-CoA dioxygenase family)|tara:strand:- start:569 stop:1438 length:870 start_codon:yes stop_codon:yes gene_type:complete
MSAPSAEPLRPVTDDEIARFDADGFVHLPGILPTTWLEHLAGPVDETIIDPSTTVDMTALGAGLGGTEDPKAGGGRFLSGVDHWLHHEAFAAFATTSPLPAIAGVLMGARRVHLYEDSVLVKEPGTADPTVFHQDLSYFHLAGERICTCWIPLDPVSVDTGAMAYVRGSHLSGSVYRPNWFVNRDPLPGTAGKTVPDIRHDDDRVVRIPARPGDVIVHHAATLHGAGPNRSATVSRRAVSVRYCGDGVRYEIRPGAPTKPHHAEVRSGDPVVDHPGCPLVWSRPLGSGR